MESWEIRHARVAAMSAFEGGDLPGARSALDKLIAALGSPDTAQRRMEAAECLVDRATVLRFSNDWRNALADLGRARSLGEDLPALPKRSVLTNVLLLQAKIHSTSHSQSYDLPAAQQAIDALRALGWNNWFVHELQSHVAFQRRDWEQAADLALQAATELEQEGWARGVAACRRRAGEALLETGRLDEARAELDAALAFFEAHGPPDLLSETHLALARVRSLGGEHEAAWAMAMQALEEVESRVRRFRDVEEQQRFLLDKLRYYDHAFDIGLRAGGDEGVARAWSTAERSKSFYLANLLANADVPLLDGVDPERVRAWERLGDELDACERALGQLSNGRRDGADATRLEARLRELSDAQARQLREIMKEHPRWLTLRAPPAFDIASGLAALPDGVVPVSYFWRDDASAGATLHVFSTGEHGRTEHEAVPWTRAHVEELIACGAGLKGDVSHLARVFPEGTTDRVLPPVTRSRIPATARLLVSPHGRLRGFPLHALPLDDSILIERWPVQITPSLALAPIAPVRGPGGPSVLLMGSPENAFGDPPLPDVDAELNELASVWSGKVPEVEPRIVSRDQTPEDVGCPPSSWHEFGVLHFACHGAFPEDRPFDAALRLGSDAVRGSELFATSLTAKLVALSACSLGRRAERWGDAELVGEEWIGLYLPLFYAGARALVVSLWNADSYLARRVMVALHEALVAGAEPDVAFRAAILSVRRKLTPLWANWCLVGIPSRADARAAGRPRDTQDYS